MASAKEQMNSSKIFILVALLMNLICSCTIGRIYMGSEIRNDPKEKIKIGSTTKSEILEAFGPPERIQMQYDGDIFVYAYLRKNSSQLALREPYFTKLSLFQYTRTQQKSDRLAIVFDKGGVVRSEVFH